MDTLQTLETALSREMNGQKTYQEAAAKVNNRNGKQLLEWLAQEETGHIKLIEKALTELKENKQWLTRNMWGSSEFMSEPVRASEFPSKPTVMGNLPEDAPELSIIEKAIEAEKADAEFYMALARNVDDPEGTIMIEKLAHIEKGHVSLLEEEWEWVKHSKDLFTLHRFSPVESGGIKSPEGK